MRARATTMSARVGGTLLKNVKLSVRLGGLFLIVLAAFAAFALVTFRTVDEIKITSPLYKQIISDKDVVADVLPPPKYIVESFLCILRLQGIPDDPTAARMFERSQQLRTEYYDRHAVWDKELPEGPLRKALQVDSFEPARKFFEIRDSEFLPAIQRARAEKDPVLAAAMYEDTRKLIKEKLEPLYEQHRIGIDEVVRLANASSKKNELHAATVLDERQSYLKWLGIGIVIVAIALMLLTISITNRLGKHLITATDAATRVAEGDLTVSVAADASDEAGRLLASIKSMTGSLNSLVTRVKEASIQLMSTATQFSATSTEQEATINGFGASTAQIAAAVREISATSQELLATMDNVRGVATAAARLADEGRAGLAGMDASMQQLDRSTGSISSKLSVIREKAADINLVVTTITKVADQTNLLSVNAAIEAEKAGEYGLGFLVLAREIRRLADQTAVSTLDIEQMVRQMQTAVTAGVMEMDRFAEDVRQGVTTVARISSQLGEIIERVGQINQRFETVNEGMRAQSQGAKQINDAMLQLNEGARQTAGSVRELNSATSHLRTAVDGLKTEISHFKVSN
jgi:methyl-accepting chemotaxis protein WspA